MVTSLTHMLPPNTAASATAVTASRVEALQLTHLIAICLAMVMSLRSVVVLAI